MSLSDLSARELARIDGVCLDFETRLRAGEKPVIDEIVLDRGGEHPELLRNELQAVLEEIERAAASRKSPDAVDGSKTGSIAASDGQLNLPQIGAQLGPYVITDSLGRGGMGVVYKAIDRRLNRVVAIKMLAVGGANQKELTERFDREARAVAAITHPNIVELFDVGVESGLPYAVMEFLDGETLDVALQRDAIAAEEVRVLGFQIADALASAHAGGVIHRDLKPHNIMLLRRNSSATGDASQPSAAFWSRSGDALNVKLFDFGLCRVPRSGLDDTVDAETRAGVVLGTPGYMAPEQARGESVTAAADVFSLGCVLYEAFYGRRAFDGSTNAARYASTLEDTPVADPIRRRDDTALADLIDRCLRKNPDERPESALAIAEILRRDASVHSMLATSKSGYVASRPARRHFLEAVVGGLLGAATGLALQTDPTVDLRDINSLAVLSFSEASAIEPAVASTMTPPPIGNKNLHRGEQLAALLVNELTRLDDVSVPPFRPMTANTPQEFRQLGQQLEVDAMLTGTFRTSTQGAREFLELDIQIISSRTGNRLWGDQIHSDAGDNLLEQTKLASDIASRIGHRLTSTADQSRPPSVESFSCLVDAKTRSDPDSVPGLEMALICFQKAHEADARFVDPLAGIALTSVTLAAQSETSRALELIQTARASADEALALDARSIDARLADAILNWQAVSRYQQAERDFRELAISAPNNWQVKHQYGLLQLAIGDTAAAVKSLHEASQLNPMSVVVKVDRARAAWFAGNPERAIEDAKRIQARFENKIHAHGLLIDIYEQQGRYQEAAAIHENIQLPDGFSPDDYFAARAAQLDILPYGPFGPAMNRAILQTRVEGGLDELSLAALADTPPPMLPFLLATHPSFSSTRLLERAKEILPESRR